MWVLCDERHQILIIFIVFARIPNPFCCAAVVHLPRVWGLWSYGANEKSEYDTVQSDFHPRSTQLSSRLTTVHPIPPS